MVRSGVDPILRDLSPCNDFQALKLLSQVLHSSCMLFVFVKVEIVDVPDTPRLSGDLGKCGR